MYWSWNGGPREGRGMEAIEKGGQISGGGGAGGGWDSIFENDQSSKVNNVELGIDLFRYSTEITGAKWPDLSVARSPCPTLNVIGAISKSMIEKEELKRMAERPGLNADGTPIKLSKRKRAKLVAQKVVGGVTSNTVGRVLKFAGKRLLGRVPDEAIEGSYQEEKPLEESPTNVVPALSISEKDQELLEKEISTQIFNEDMKTDTELFEAIAAKEIEPTLPR